MTLANKKRTGVGLERKLHIPVVIKVLGIAVKIMHAQKGDEGNTLAPVFMFRIMLKQQGQLYQLTQLGTGQKVQGQKQYCNKT